MAWAIAFCCGLLVVTFAVAAAAKLADRHATADSLIAFGLPENGAARWWWALPAIELVVVGLLVVDSTRRIGAVLAVLLLVGFSIALANQIRRGSTAPCNCFGSLSSAPVRARLIWRNAALAVAAIAVGVGPDIRWTGWITDLDQRERVLFALAASGLAVSAALSVQMQRMWRTQQDLSDSVKVVEALLDDRDSHREVEQVPAPPPGLPIGIVAPSFVLPDCDGTITRLDDLIDGVRPVLLAFVGGGCGACERLMPMLEKWAAEGRVAVAAIVTGAESDNSDLFRRREGVSILVDEAGAVAAEYQAQWTPAAVVIASDGRLVTRAAYGVDRIGSLVTNVEETLALPIASNIDATVIDRITSAGGGGVNAVVFWNNSCGFCRRFADDLLAVEFHRPVGTPALVFVTGEVPSPSFASPVVLDADRSVARAFGSPGTPSAVLVDGAGTQRSDLVSGAPLIRQLLGIDPEFGLRHAQLPSPTVNTNP